MNKSQLRKHMSEVIKELSLTEKQKQSKIVFDKLINHPIFKAAKNVSIYLSTENEIDTKSILKHALEVESKRCFIPLVKKSKKTTPSIAGATSECLEARMNMVELKSMRDYQALPVNNYGIKEPKEDFVSESAELGKINLDLVLVPGVAFSLDGRRLGHGKGYYDEYLGNWCNQLNERNEKLEVNMRRNRRDLFYTIGLAFNEQIVDHLPTVEGHDFELDEVLTALSTSTRL